MNNEIEFLSSVYEELSAPFLIADREGSIISANKALYREFPDIKTDNSLSLIFPKEAIEEILSAKDTSKMSLTGLNLSLTIMPSKDYVCLLFLKEDHKADMMKSLLLPVPHIFRSSVSEMLITVSSLYAMGEENEDYRLMELSQKLNLHCYKILRGNNLISSYCRELAPSDIKGETVDISALLKNIGDAARIVANDLGIDLNLEIEKGSVPVTADENSLVEAILAIIDNACKFSYSKEPITVKLKTIGTNAVISISDKGKGIPTDVIGHVFEPYYTFNEDAPPFSGVGLGLTLARLIAVKWGGNISITSKEYEGTTVVMTLPILTDRGDTQFNSKVTLISLLRDRFSPLHVMMSDNDTVPLP